MAASSLQPKSSRLQAAPTEGLRPLRTLRTPSAHVTSFASPRVFFFV
jgi:hypothetical protein